MSTTDRNKSDRAIVPVLPQDQSSDEADADKEPITTEDGQIRLTRVYTPPRRDTGNDKLKST